MRFTLWPCGEVNLLVTLQVQSVRLGCMPFKLHRLLSGPSHDKGANGPSDQVGVFPGRHHSVKDDLKLWGDRDAYQGRLWGAISRNTRHYAEPMSHNERVVCRLKNFVAPGKLGSLISRNRWIDGAFTND
jgi:hypothetical protein